MKNLTYQKRIFNIILRLHSRYSKKLQRLVSEGINLRKQDILSRRLAKMQVQLQGLYTAVKSCTATAAVATALTLLAPETSKAQSFAAPQTNPFGLTDIGYGSIPTFTDLDNDGDLDILSGSIYGNFLYFENIGTALNPAFADSISNPYGLNTIGKLSTPNFVDLDNDGDMDILSGEKYGSFYYFQNTGIASVPAFADSVKNPYGLSDIGFNSIPTFADLDNDGDFDMISGEKDCSFYYFENTGSISAPTFATITINPFGLSSIGGLLSNPTFFDLDSDDDIDVFIGERDGNFFYFENNGTSNVPAFADSVRNPFGLTSLRLASNPTFVDLDNDNDFDIMSGTGYGNFVYFENITTANSVAKSQQAELAQVYPNPSQGIFSIVNTAGTDNTYTVSDLAGKQITSIQNTEKNTVINLSALDKGVYFLNINNENSSQTVKLFLQ